MPGPRVAQGRPDTAGQTAGAFTQAFGQVLDAIQAGKQAKLLEDQIRSQERVKTAEQVGEFMGKVYETRAKEVGASQAAMEQSTLMGEWLTKQGYDGGAFTRATQQAYASGKEAPEILARRITSTLFASTPEQLQSLVAGISGGGMPSPGSPALGLASDTPEVESPVVETPITSDATTATPPSTAPSTPPVTIATPVGPDTPEKRTQLNDLIKGATAAAETGDFSGLEGMTSRQTLTKISTTQKAGSTQAQREQFVDTYMTRPEVQAKFEWMFGPTWKQDLMDLSSGTRQARIEAESRMVSSQAQMDRQSLELVVAALKEAGDTKRQELQIKALVDVANINKQGDVDVKTLDDASRYQVENDRAIQTNWKEIGDLFTKQGEQVARQSAKYKQLMEDIARRMAIKPEYQDKSIQVIKETIEMPGFVGAALRMLNLPGGTAESPTLQVTPKAESGGAKPPAPQAQPTTGGADLYRRSGLNLKPGAPVAPTAR